MTYRTTTTPEVALPAVVMPEPSVVTTEDVLELAAEIIENEGWIQGTFYDGSGYCVLGAISEAADRLSGVASWTLADHPWLGHTLESHDRWRLATQLNNAAVRQLAARLPHDYYAPDRRVWRWNDKPVVFSKRRLRKIVATVRAAARKEN